MDRAQYIQRHSAEEAGSDSSMGHRGRQWGAHPWQGEGREEEWAALTN